MVVMRLRRVHSVLFIAALVCTSLRGSETPAPAEGAGVVSFVKVLTDKTVDMSNLESWKKAWIKDGMTDQEKMIAIWKTVSSYQHQDGPPIEYLQHEDGVYDPVKLFNVYGYAMCCNASAHVNALARCLGYEARGWAVNHHSICEIKYDDSWHHFDASLVCYFPKADGKVASVEEITKEVLAWYKDHPDLFDGRHGIDKNLREFEKQNGRTGWKKGPEILSRAPTYNAKGWWPAGTHGWYATMQVYDGTTGDIPAHHYEYAASQGYQVNIQLRKGERLTRNWSNKGLHINLPNKGPGCMEDKSGFLKNYDASFGGSLAPGRVGNGTHEYDVPLADGSFAGGTLSMDNIARSMDDRKSPAVHIKDADKAGSFVIRMPSSYVYLTGELTCQAVVGNGGQITILFSDNNGLDYKEVSSIKASGDQKIDLKELVLRRYDYRLKFEFKGEGTGLDALKISHDIQHSQRPLPALDIGDNTITVSAGPAEGTITVEANTKLDHQGKQVSYTEFHPVVKGMKATQVAPEGKDGEITFPIQTPADMIRLRFGGHYQTWSDKDTWEYQVSFDDGKTFKSIAVAPPQERGRTFWVSVNEIPAGTRKALVKYVARKVSETVLWSVRIDADYKEPNGGLAPLKVTYNWEETGAPKQNVFIAKPANDTYKINCATKPLMKSIVLERAD
jgi:hypothetical protein